MQITPTNLSGAVVIQPKVFSDARGYFFESYSKAVFFKNGITDEFIQDNESLSQKGVLRGLHFQNMPHAQVKLVRVIQGSVLDVVVDIRKKSSTYGKYFSIVLSSANKTMLYIPEGFAHGFLVLEDNTIFSYKCSRTYNKESEDGILWCDADLNIEWGIQNPLLSEKDRVAQAFKEFKSKF
ncbi:MAG: dTDP-4-dehydrorhamnose 3,5-epimerase [Bacteroidetes bacterium]|nr:dTDP-4-dehydrorhamnose 3,5-epimerase [Bacteroidota bacterium]